MAKQLNDLEKKKIIADYIETQNLRETGRINNVSVDTVKRTISKDEDNVKQKITQKKEQNTQTVLEYVESLGKQKQQVIKLSIEALIRALPEAKSVKDIATAYGIVIDKELKIKEVSNGGKEIESDGFIEALNHKAGEIDWSDEISE